MPKSSFLLLQGEMQDHERPLVPHPFKPVYLLPLVKLCARERAAPEMLTRGDPRAMRKDVEVFIANRLPQSMLRNALWLAHDDLDAVQEIHGTVRCSFGLGRALISPLRIGSNGTAIHQFIEKWEPQLKCSWSTLTDRPELTDAVLDKLAEQSGVRAENLSSLSSNRSATIACWPCCGASTHRHTARARRSVRGRFPQLPNSPGSLWMPTRLIPSDGIDYNGGLTEGCCLRLCGIATDTLLLASASTASTAQISALTTRSKRSFSFRGNCAPATASRYSRRSANDKRRQLFHLLTRAGDEGPAAPGRGDAGQHQRRQRTVYML
ncbi:hypothetical protein QA640_37515 [Bradyrhizobium sp. CB82]|uniref:hypothetical protein n=1 Tax=Bradyrhizobium sp. CB82 TaxID=3039159 RepID=UPI0024B0B6E1|nr:hypothetical protein [Bradyrhizobium sp. CB82]WFU39937.1 hypothetical protein QA640_37515 [Bradyrhizobium sp. CB82]